MPLWPTWMHPRIALQSEPLPPSFVVSSLHCSLKVLPSSLFITKNPLYNQPYVLFFFFKPYLNISFSGDLNRYKAILWWVSILVMCMNRETLSSQKMSLIQASAKGRLTGHLDSTVLTFIWFFLWDNVSLLLSPLHITQLPKVMQKSNFYTRLTAFSWLPLNI